MFLRHPKVFASSLLDYVGSQAQVSAHAAGDDAD